MRKSKIIDLIDKIFITSAIFLIVYAWINFFLRSLYLTFVFSLLFTFALTFSLFYFTNKKLQKKNLTKNYLQEIDKTFLAFKLLKNEDKKSLMKSILLKDNTISITSQNLTYLKNNQQHQIVFNFHQEKLTENQLINTIANKEDKTEILQIVCEDYEPNLNTNIVQNLKIEIITKKVLYDNFFLTYNTFPNTSILNTEIKNIGFKKIFKNFFIPSKSKGYFVCGLILVFSSIILPFHTYYLIFGTTLLTFSIVCKIIPLLKS